MTEEQQQGMRILQVLGNISGGMETHVYGLIRFLAGRQDIDGVDIVIPEDRLNNIPQDIRDLSEAESSKVSIHTHLPVHGSSREKIDELVGINDELANIVRRTSPSIIHIHDPLTARYSRITPLQVGGKRVPLLYTAHILTFIDRETGEPRPDALPRERSLLERTDYIIQVSEAMKQLAQRDDIRLWREGRDKVIHPGVQDRKVDEDYHPLERDPEKINIGFVGRFEHRIKGLDVFIDAFGDMDGRDKERFKIHMIGDNISVGINSSLASVQTQQIKNYGWIDNAHIDDYIKDLDVVVLPSRMEPLGLSIEEAMRNGNAVIVSDRGGMPELVVTSDQDISQLGKDSLKFGQDASILEERRALFIDSLQQNKIARVAGRTDLLKPYGFIFEGENSYALAQILRNVDKPILQIMGNNARKAYERDCVEDIGFNKIMDTYREVIARGQGQATGAGTAIS